MWKCLYQYSETKFYETLHVTSLDIVSLLQKRGMEIIYMMRFQNFSAMGSFT